MSVRVYVEGGGNYKRSTDACRRGFSEFFAKVVPLGGHPRVIPGGSRQATFEDFRTAMEQHPNDFVIMVVDSEGPVAAGVRTWDHLRSRDNWAPPASVTDEQAHLMVQCMEAWLLADQGTLRDFYDQGFLINSLPGNQNVEEISRYDVIQALEHASRNTPKGEYHKVRHGFQLLCLIDPARVRNASRHADLLLQVLIRRSGSTERTQTEN